MGLRYTNFHSTSLCSPTRAAIITGRNHHTNGFGVVGEIATGFPGILLLSFRKENGTVGTILRDNGYATSWFGKNHNTSVLSRRHRPDRSINGRPAWASNISTASSVAMRASGSRTCIRNTTVDLSLPEGNSEMEYYDRDGRRGHPST